MQKLTFSKFFSSLGKIKFDKFDLIVAIGKGGIIPSVFIHEKLKIPIEIIWINFRDETNKQVRKEPVIKIINKKLKKIKNKKILLVDDVARTGKTLKKAKTLLKGNKIKTFVVNGKADYNILNKTECVRLPWN